MHADRNQDKAEPKPEQWQPGQKQSESCQNARPRNYKDMHNNSRGRCRIGMMDLCHICRGMRLTLIKIIGVRGQLNSTIGNLGFGL